MDEKVIKALRILSDRTVELFHDDVYSKIRNPKTLQQVKDQQWEEIKKVLEV